MKKPAKTKLFNLTWIVNGKQVETLLINKPFALCKWTQAQKEITTHKTGKLIILENK
jgi:hypothetical protein